VNQPVLPTPAFAGGVPANLACGFCGRPVRTQFFRAVNRFACSDCAAQVKAVIDKNSVAPASFLAAGGAGLLTALVGGAIWAASVQITHANIGFIALFIGYGVGKVVHYVSGKRRSVSLQWLSTILAIIGVAAGKLALVSWQIVDVLKANEVDVTIQNVVDMLQRNIKTIGDPFDLLWMGIAAYAAWRICRPPQISLAGPYAYEPSSGSLQFNTVEPLHDIPPATPPGNP
jgi:hypothetical protein